MKKRGIDKSCRPPREVIYRKFYCNKEGVKKLFDKRQDGLTLNRRIDTRVACPAEKHVRLHFLFDRRSWVVTKFIDSHSHELSSLDKVHQHYSHQTHRSKISRSIMSNLVDVEIRPSNIFCVVKAMNHGESCEEISSQQARIWSITFTLTTHID